MTIAELNQVATRLAATAKYLAGLSRGGAPAKSGGSAGGGKRKRQPAGDAKAIEAKIVAALKGSKKGLSTADLAKKTSLRRERAFYYLQKLRASKRVKMTGVRNTARWHA